MIDIKRFFGFGLDREKYLQIKRAIERLNSRGQTFVSKPKKNKLVIDGYMPENDILEAQSYQVTKAWAIPTIYKDIDIYRALGGKKPVSGVRITVEYEDWREPCKSV